MAIVYRDLSPGPGFPCAAMIFEPGAGVTEMRHFDSFSEAYVVLDEEGWEPMHAEFDPNTFLPSASFRMKVDKKDTKKGGLQTKMDNLMKVRATSQFAEKMIDGVNPKLKK